MSAAAPTPAAGTPSTGLLTASIFTAVLAIAFESVGVSTAMPRAAADLGALDYYAWAFSLFVVGMLTATVLGGRASDRLGPVRPVLVGFAVFLVGLLVAGTAVSMPQLFVGRFVQGIGAGLINVASNVLVAHAYADAARARVMTWVSTAWVVPSLLGPPLAAWITETWSWHWVFLLIVPLVLLAAAVGLVPLLRVSRTLDDHADADRNPVPWWSGAAVALGAVALQLVGQRVSAGRLGLSELGLVAVAAAALVVGLPRLMPPGFARLGRGLPAVIVSRALSAGAYNGAIAFVPLMVIQTRHTGLLLAGAIVTLSSLGWFAGAWLQSQRWLSVERPRLIGVGLGLIVLGAVAMTLTSWFDRSPLWLVAIGWLPAGLGMGLSVAPSTLVTMTLSSPAQQGRNSSSLAVGDALGSSLIVGVAGTIFASLHAGHPASVTFAALMAAMTGFAVLAALAATRIGRLRP